jgi:hypothetical protein
MFAFVAGDLQQRDDGPFNQAPLGMPIKNVGQNQKRALAGDRWDRGGAAQETYCSGDVLGDGLAEGALGNRADDRINLFATFEDHQGGNAANSVLAGDVRVFIGI